MLKKHHKPSHLFLLPLNDQMYQCMSFVNLSNGNHNSICKHFVILLSVTYAWTYSPRLFQLSPGTVTCVYAFPAWMISFSPNRQSPPGFCEQLPIWVSFPPRCVAHVLQHVRTDERGRPNVVCAKSCLPRWWNDSWGLGVQNPVRLIWGKTGVILQINSVTLWRSLC